jgi:hypothetical protein
MNLEEFHFTQAAVTSWILEWIRCLDCGAPFSLAASFVGAVTFAGESPEEKAKAGALA